MENLKLRDLSNEQLINIIFRKDDLERRLRHEIKVLRRINIELSQEIETLKIESLNF